MYFIIGIILIYTVFCVISLVRDLNEDFSEVKKVLYTISTVIVLPFALVLPLLLNVESELVRGFIAYLGIYFVTFALFIPDEIIRDKKRTTLLQLLRYVLNFYLVVYMPIVLFNTSNALPLFQGILRTILLSIFFFGISYFIRNIGRFVKNQYQAHNATLWAVIVLLVVFLFGHSIIGEGVAKKHDQRDTNEIYFDDDFYIANEYRFTVEGIGIDVYDYLVDDDYMYIVSRTAAVDYVYVTLLDVHTLTIVKTYEFQPNDTNYAWYTHQYQDFIFKDNDQVFFTFIDGIYLIDQTEALRISDMSDQESHKFVYNNKYHFVTLEGNSYNIYRIENQTLMKVDSIQDDDLVVSSANNYLVLKNLNTNLVTVYPNTVYSIPQEMIEYPVLSVNDNEILLSHTLNPLLVEFGDVTTLFRYYRINLLNEVEEIEIEDYMFALREYTVDGTKVIYETFPKPQIYSYDFEDLTVPDKFIEFNIDTEYDLNQLLLIKEGKLHIMYSKTTDFTTNNIYVEINQIQRVQKTVDLGYLTDFSKESFIITIVVVIAYSGYALLKKSENDLLI